MNQRFYFETSAVNFLYELFLKNKKHSSVKTKALQISKGRRWYISTVTLWEIFKTKDEKLRYDLYDFCRCLFYNHLIKSHEEIIVNYLKSNCPTIEKSYCFDASDSCLFAKEWRTACKDLKFVFYPDRDQLNQITEHMQFFGKYFFKWQNGYTLRKPNELIDQSYNYLGIRFNSLIELLFNEFENITEEQKQYVAVVFHVAIIIVCYGITPNHQVFESFWNSIDVPEPKKRVEAMVENFKSAFFRGPISNIAKMIILQTENKYGRGLIFDSLHAPYTTYCDKFFSADNHFIRFRDSIKGKDPNMCKIVHMQDVEFFIPVVSP